MRFHKLKESLPAYLMLRMLPVPLLAYLMRHKHYRMLLVSLMLHKMFRMMQQPLPQPLCSNPLNLKVP
jgi:hypothetical protein